MLLSGEEEGVVDDLEALVGRADGEAPALGRRLGYAVEEPRVPGVEAAVLPVRGPALRARLQAPVGRLEGPAVGLGLEGRAVEQGVLGEAAPRTRPTKPLGARTATPRGTLYLRPRAAL